MHPYGCGRSGGRVVEGARLESEYTAKPYRGFESLPLRHFTLFGLRPAPDVLRNEYAPVLVDLLRKRIIGKAVRTVEIDDVA